MLPCRLVSFLPSIISVSSLVEKHTDVETTVVETINSISYPMEMNNFGDEICGRTDGQTGECTLNVQVSSS
jgi:hypothetical protein